MSKVSDFSIVVLEYRGADATVTIPENVTEIGHHAFAEHKEIKSLVLPEGLVTIGVGAFRDCTALSKVTLPGSLREIDGDAFSGCTALREIVLPEGLVTLVNSAFEGCTALETVTLPDSLAADAPDFEPDAFEGCTALKRFRVPRGSKVRQLPDVLGVAAVDLDGKPIPPVAEAVPVNAADWKYEVRAGEVCITGRNTRFAGTLYEDEDILFPMLYIPAEIEGLPVTSIGPHAFQSDEDFGALYLPDGLRRIEEEAFEGTSVCMARLPQSLEYVSDDAFDSCYAISETLCAALGIEDDEDDDEDDDDDYYDDEDEDEDYDDEEDDEDEDYDGDDEEEDEDGEPQPDGRVLTFPPQEKKR